MRTWRVRSLLIVAVVTLVGGGCSDSSPPMSTADGSEPAADAIEPQEVKIVAVDYAYTEVPAEIEAGTINLTFENQGTVGHEATLTGIGATPIQQYIEDLGGRRGLEGMPNPGYVDQVAVPPFVSIEGGKTGEATFTLTEGRYALWCSIIDAAEGDKKTVHYELGMMRELIVDAGDAAPQLPDADGAITASDYTFEVDLEGGDRTVNFINEGPDQVHFSTVEVYAEGVDAQEAEGAFRTQLEPGPMPDGVPSPSGLGFSGIFSTGLGSRFELFEGEFEAGRTYVFACWVPDREGGKPHAKAYGMYEIVTIE